MKIRKIVKVLCYVILILVVCVSQFECGNSNDSSGINSTISGETKDDSVGNADNKEDKVERSVKIDTKKLFDYYFSYGSSSDFQSSHIFSDNNKSSYGTYSTNTITISPYLTGFVDYSGYVVLKPEYDSNDKSSKVLKNRRIDVDYWGSAIDTYVLTNETTQHDKTISFDGVTYKFYSANIVIKYHDEGLSGDKELSFHSINITKYNYKSYLTIKIENRYMQYTNDYGYTYKYYQIYSIYPTRISVQCMEFNNITITFDNGISFTLNAIGKSEYRSENSDEKKSIPVLSSISGRIDIYPSAS